MSIDQVLACGMNDLIASTAIGEQLSIDPQSQLHPSSDFCSALELYFPILLRAKYGEWENESLDGVFVRSACKVGVCKIQLHGTAILITDQSAVPFKAELELRLDTIPTIACSLSICDKNQAQTNCNSEDVQTLLSSVSNKGDKINWKYEV